MKNYVFLLLMSLLAASCSKEDNNENFVSDTAIGIRVQDSLGNDLLDPNGPDRFKQDSINIYYLTEKGIERYYKGTADYPENFYIRQAEDSSCYEMVLFINDNEAFENPITYVSWNSKDTDTIKAYYRRGEGYSILDFASYNGHPCDSTVGDCRLFHITK